MMRKAKTQTIWVADISITLGGQSNLVTGATANPYDTKSIRRRSRP